MAEAISRYFFIILNSYENNTRQRPTFPWPFSHSIIGPRGLNGRVRYGNGCGPSGMATGNNGLNGLMDQRQLNGQASRPISAGELNPLQDLHLRSINPVVYGGPSGCLAAPGFLILGRVSRLDAFSGYPFRTWLPSNAAGATTGTPEVRPSRSSRTRDSSPQESYAHDR